MYTSHTNAMGLDFGGFTLWPAKGSKTYHLLLISLDSHPKFGPSIPWPLDLDGYSVKRPLLHFFEVLSQPGKRFATLLKSNPQQWIRPLRSSSWFVPNISILSLKCLLCLSLQYKMIHHVPILCRNSKHWESTLVFCTHLEIV